MDDIDRETSFIAVWRQYPVATMLAGVLGAVIGISAVIGLLSSGIALFQAAGDEPPIRVKNGTLDIDLPSGSGQWEEEGDRRHWKIKGNLKKKTTDLTVALFPVGAKSCKATTATSKSVVIKYSDGQTVTFEAKNKATKVTATADLNSSQNDEVLSYQASGYISEVLAGSSMCSFNSAQELSLVLIWY